MESCVDSPARRIKAARRRVCPKRAEEDGMSAESSRARIGADWRVAVAGLRRTTTPTRVVCDVTVNVIIFPFCDMFCFHLQGDSTLSSFCLSFSRPLVRWAERTAGAIEGGSGAKRSERRDLSASRRLSRALWRWHDVTIPFYPLFLFFFSPWG